MFSLSVPVPAEYREKERELKEIISQNKQLSVEQLRHYAKSPGGFVTDDIRQELWHRLLQIDLSAPCENSNKNDLLSHSEYSQVVLDVNRSLKRFPPGIPIEQRLALQDQLTLLILKVIHAYPRLRYYQIKYRRERNKDYTSWCVTSTLLNRYSDVVRLYDYFLASPKLLPIYLISVIVLHREEDILQTSCEMPSVHCLLSQLPEDLPFERLSLSRSLKIYFRSLTEYPPDQIKQEVDERVIREAEKRKKEMEEIAVRRKLLEQAKLNRAKAANSLRQRLFYWVPSWVAPTTKFGLVFWTASIAVGLYAMMKVSDANPNLIPLYQR
ncbi:TBC1 domain family member 20-like [Diaphorina citri]|uniref:TBC1 domain family member 20-like n=1 Tax=Diaphorina citri TaxID=121845 RepID=A0A3Q0IRH7_DIACI|nr:TBC1 domain family member 20-like [Diaphorina citri]